MMPKETQNRFKVLKVLSDKRSRISDQFEEDIKNIEKQILDKKKPIYEKRRQIIAAELTDFSEFVPKFEENFK